ncbi:MAG TPA: OpgC domain-containing protein, partial [Nevskiaceae bacterium]|nr:OpgC domain-containing protein [Nevskiaceae bacterium]
MTLPQYGRLSRVRHAGKRGTVTTLDPIPSMRRNTGLDALRGLMLASMALTHLPTAASRWSSQPLGFVSNAEGFVFLSAFLVGVIYRRPALESLRAVGTPMWRRTLQLYRYQLLTLAFAFTIGAWLALAGQRPGVSNLLDWYLAHPVRALLQGALLIYQPPLMDILPIYILFLAATPLLLR